MYNITIPDVSEIRMKKKLFRLRMNLHPMPGKMITTDTRITHLKRILYLMIDEDLQRPLGPTVRAGGHTTSPVLTGYFGSVP
jgi:hypothetical protein